MTKSEMRAVAESLYLAAYIAAAPEKVFSQEDLFGLDVVPGADVELLAECLNHLTSDGLFKLMSKDGRTCWKVVSREEAAKYKSLTQEEALIYSYIESAGREGIWVKLIRTKSNLHMTPLNKGLRTLEGKGLVKKLQTQRQPGRRVYMLSSLQPPEEVSGGPFYTDGKMDYLFINVACFWLEREIAKKSWHRTPVESSSKKRVKIVVDDEVEGTGVEKKHKRRHRASSPYAESQEFADEAAYTLMPPGYASYPTIGELTLEFNKWTGAHVKLKEDEVTQLVNLLCWDGKVERVRGGEKETYRTVYPKNLNGGMGKTAFTAAPCGRCPVFDLCEDEGPVNARSCVYYQHWLSGYSAEVF